jgi:hypothetical protein
MGLIAGAILDFWEMSVSHFSVFLWLGPPSYFKVSKELQAEILETAGGKN